MLSRQGREYGVFFRIRDGGIGKRVFAGWKDWQCDEVLNGMFSTLRSYLRYDFVPPFALAPTRLAGSVPN